MAAVLHLGMYTEGCMIGSQRHPELVVENKFVEQVLHRSCLRHPYLRYKIRSLRSICSISVLRKTYSPLAA
jgi:hypothetical protein